jgi:hypothetical protein
VKRFTETTKWSANPWFRKLSCRHKCLWNFLCDICDAAGVAAPDWELFSFQIGEAVTEDDLGAFEGRVRILANGKLWIVGFIDYQYGELSRECRAHNPVFKSLETNGIEYPIDTLSDTLSKGYPKVSERDKDKDKDKDKDRDSVEEGCGEKPSEPITAAAIVDLYPRREKQREAIEHVLRHIKAGVDPQSIVDGTKAIAAVIPQMPSGHLNAFVPSAAAFFQNRRWEDDPRTWLRPKTGNGGQNTDPGIGARRPANVIKIG